MFLLTLLAACQSPQVQVELPSDTGTNTPQGPFDIVRLVPQSSQTMADSGLGLEGGDVDGDGFADVGFVASGGELAWAQGDGEGNLSIQTLLPDGLLITRLGQALGTDGVDEDSFYIPDLKLVDLDGDGQVEWLLTASAQVDAEYTQLTLVLSDPLNRADLEVVGPGSHLAQAVSDLDGDGLPELVLFGEDSAVHTSGGDVWPLPDAVDWNYYPQVAAMDLDGQGDRDLVVFLNGGFGISEIHPYTQDGEGLVPGPVNDEVFANQASISLASDGEQEALLLFGDSAQRMSQDGLVDEFLTDTFFYGSAQGDLDGDGAMDLLLMSGQVPVLYASGPAGPLASIPMEGLDQALHSAVVLDLDADGRQDLVGTRWDDASGVTVLESWLNLSGE